MKTAYPQVMGTCTITLYSNIPFDNTYKNHSLISDLFTYKGTGIYTGTSAFGLPKERFINRQRLATGYPYYYPRWTLTGVYNFNFSNGLVGSITLELTPAQTNANYMKLVCGNDVYYYFITGISQNNFETFTLSLELDVLMTYQDEFLQGVENIPVFTNRKHCHRYTNNGLMPHCVDLKSGDSTFSGVKPSYVTDIVKTHFKNTQLKQFEGIYWAYICYDQTIVSAYGGDINLPYKYKGVFHPLLMACVPVNMKGTLKLIDAQTSGTFEITPTDVSDIMEDVIGNGAVHAIKLSPYPPFASDSAMLVHKTGDDIEVTSTNIVITGVGGGSELATWTTGKTKLRFIVGGSKKKFLIEEEKTGGYELDDVTLPNIKNASAPTILSSRFTEPKLLFSPFKKYKLSSAYCEGCEFYPELIYSIGYFTNAKITLTTIASCFIGDYTFYTYIDNIDDNNHTAIIGNYYYESIGLASNVNYILPAGTNALDVFNTTQSQSFYTSKVASGITSGLTMAGGIASIVIGAVTEMPTAGASTAMIAGGITALAQGTASMANTIKSTSAKIEDLKNTPDSINVSGSSFTSDLGKTDYLFPYVVVYSVGEEMIHKANDFFYNYGYEVSRECYFNTELYLNNNSSNVVDNNIFGRTIFNYVQTNDDMTNKINADIPLIIKQKLSKIFNDGITLWNFYGFNDIWGTAGVGANPDYYVDKWLFKHDYDNTELSIMVG